MSEIIAAVPDDFVLVSGDDSLAVAAMAVGARGLISVASNAVPAEIVQIIEFAERQDYLAARRLHHWLLPFLQVNFVESNPIPIKAAMAAMGLMDDTYRLPTGTRQSCGARPDHDGAAGSEAARVGGSPVTRPFARSLR